LASVSARMRVNSLMRSGCSELLFSGLFRVMVRIAPSRSARTSELSGESVIGIEIRMEDAISNPGIERSRDQGLSIHSHIPQPALHTTRRGPGCLGRQHLCTFARR